MDLHIGIKPIHGQPMNRADYCKYRGWELPADENGEDEGYLVEYEASDGNPPNHPNHEGYVSWSPRFVYENAYKNVKLGVCFGSAIFLLRRGSKVARKGWNGKNMFLYYVPATEYRAITAVAQAEFGNTVPYGAYIAMKTATGEVVPWLASQTDMLATDWVVVD